MTTVEIVLMQTLIVAIRIVTTIAGITIDTITMAKIQIIIMVAHKDHMITSIQGQSSQTHRSFIAGLRGYPKIVQYLLAFDWSSNLRAIFCKCVLTRFFRKGSYFEKENRESMGMKDGSKNYGGRSPFNRDDGQQRRSFRDGGRDNGHGGRGGSGRSMDGHMDRSDGDSLFGSHDNRNNRRTVRLNPNPSAKITFVNDHCTRGEMDPSDKE